MVGFILAWLAEFRRPRRAPSEPLGIRDLPTILESPTPPDVPQGSDGGYRDGGSRVEGHADSTRSFTFESPAIRSGARLHEIVLSRGVRLLESQSGSRSIDAEKPLIDGSSEA